MPDRRSFPSHGRSGIVPWIVAALAFGTAPSIASPVPYWGQTQSHLEALDDAPLIAANWHGRYRPYVHGRDAFAPLLTGDHPEIADVDLVSPLPVSPHQVLLLGSASGRPEYDLYLYDRASGALSNATATPAIDEGRPCIDVATGLLAYRTGTGEQIARVGDGLSPLAHGRLPAFEACTWVDATTLLGIERVGRTSRMHRCRVEANAIACEPTAALDTMETVTGFQRPRSPLAVVARRRGEMFRRPWVLSTAFDGLAPAAAPDTQGDVLDFDGDGALRVGFQGRYRSSLASGSDATVYVVRRIGAATYAIIATDRMTRTLARLEHGTWQPLRDPSVAMPARIATPLEVWMRSPAGEVYQAFYFGAPHPERVVVWWHGGPAESISPRFNPYFHRLNELGFGVLAVNYPGSTGRGAVYEARFLADMLGDCVRATWAYLRENAIGTVVSWSVSSGISVQSALLAQQVPISAIVDQAAWGRSHVRADAARRGIPTFAIRGRYDPYGPIDTVDHWYPGGHDVTTADDFASLFAAVAPFLAAAPRLSWPARGDAESVLEVVAAEADESVGFELATHVRRTCFPGRDVVVSPTGVPALNGAARVRESVATWLADHPATPVFRIDLRPDTPATTATPDAGRMTTLRPIDLAAPGESDRLRAHAIANDGWLVHPRLQAVAESQCAALRPPAAPYGMVTP